MKLIGYTKEISENSFTIPIYSDNKENYFYHKLDKNLSIIDFETSYISEKKIIKYNLEKDFQIGDFGVLAFVGFNNTLFIGEADIIIDKIESYLNHCSSSDSLFFTKNEILEIKSKLIKEVNTASLDNSVLSKGKKIIVSQIHSFDPAVEGDIEPRNYKNLNIIYLECFVSPIPLRHKLRHGKLSKSKRIVVSFDKQFIMNYFTKVLTSADKSVFSEYNGVAGVINFIDNNIVELTEEYFTEIFTEEEDNLKKKVEKYKMVRAKKR